METFSIKVRKIGNSKGIVIPQKFLKTVENEKEEITIEVGDTGILLKTNKPSPRKDWAKAFFGRGYAATIAKSAKGH